MIKFISMVGVPLVSKEAKKEAPKVPFIKADPSQFRELLAQKRLDNRARIDSLGANGFGSQIGIINSRIEEECLDEVCKVYGFKKIKDDGHAFGDSALKNVYDAYKHHHFGTTIAVRVAAFSLFTFPFFVVMAHFGKTPSFMEEMGELMAVIDILGFISGIIMGLIESSNATENTRSGGWQSTHIALTDEQMAAIKTATDLDMFTEINVVSRLGDQIAVVCKRGDINGKYKIA